MISNSTEIKLSLRLCCLVFSFTQIDVLRELDAAFHHGVPRLQLKLLIMSEKFFRLPLVSVFGP